MVSGYCAINLLSVGDAIVVGLLSPVFTGIAGQVLLGERWDTTDRIAGACSLVGITLIARPVFIFGNIFGDVKPDVDGSIFVLTGFASAQLLVYKNKLAFVDGKEEPLDPTESLGLLGSKDDMLVVANHFSRT